MAKQHIYAYMRKSTNKESQRLDRQEQTLKQYAEENGFQIDEWFSDVITGATNAASRPNYSKMKDRLREADTVLITDIDRLGRDADNVIMEMKELRAMGVRVVALDVPYLNDWGNVHDDSMYKMIIDIVITLKAHMAQQEKEKIQSRIKQGLAATKEKGTRLGRPPLEVPKEFVREYERFKEGAYGKITATQFARLMGMGRSTLYKYIDKLEMSA